MKMAAKSVFVQSSRSSKSGETKSSLTKPNASGASSSTHTPVSPQSTDPEAIPVSPESQVISTQTGQNSGSTETKPPNSSASNAPCEVPTALSALMTGRPSSPVTETTRASSELDQAADEFQKNYKQFSRRYILIDKELESTFQNAKKGDDIKHTAKIFGDNVLTTIKTIEKKKGIIQGKWTNQVGVFLTKLYPLASLACDLTAAVAEAFPP